MKKKITVEVNYALNWTYGVTLSKIKEDIEALEKLGVEEIDISIEHTYGNAEIEITPIAFRLETDEEYKKRLEKDKIIFDRIKEDELRQFEIIKAKYNL